MRYFTLTVKFVSYILARIVEGRKKEPDDLNYHILQFIQTSVLWLKQIWIFWKIWLFETNVSNILMGERHTCDIISYHNKKGFFKPIQLMIPSPLNDKTLCSHIYITIYLVLRQHVLNLFIVCQKNFFLSQSSLHTYIKQKTLQSPGTTAYFQYLGKNKLKQSKI